MACAGWQFSESSARRRSSTSPNLPSPEGDGILSSVALWHFLTRTADVMALLCRTTVSLESVLAIARRRRYL